ncbi:hypothetical protein D0Z07_2678 [Hyphodiscus hymeniophilus]|uniref:DUF726-domain-containing protein n=1 Tax=Hyphodiscus hymeniophilus TaxID=353542 RepID=A0A9P7AZB0_9HELO|nr:hypothetical protein D0Z07_2678 [Hyphodiscus hymeniophilus]
MPQSEEESNADTTDATNINGAGNGKEKVVTDENVVAEKDEFGLPIRNRALVEDEGVDEASDKEDSTLGINGHAVKGEAGAEEELNHNSEPGESGSEDEFKDARSTPNPLTHAPQTPVDTSIREPEQTTPNSDITKPTETVQEVESPLHEKTEGPELMEEAKSQETTAIEPKLENPGLKDNPPTEVDYHPRISTREDRARQVEHITQKEEEVKEEDDEWQPMPAFAPYDIYDDDNRLIAREAVDSDNDVDNDGLGGAGKGYTRIQLDEDAQSATSLDENTQYLFKDINGGTGAGMEDEEQRDAVSQMQATKDLLTEGQRIAYVGMTRLILAIMVDQAELMIDPKLKGSKKDLQTGAEAMKMWSQKMMVRLYAHMEISAAEQIMVEQLSEHGVLPSDLTPTLMQNARVKNPMADEKASMVGLSSPRPSSMASTGRSPRPSISSPQPSMSSPKLSTTPREEEPATQPPPYQQHEGEDLPEVRTPSQLPTTANLDIDLRWTVLCDLFLTLIADSVYDARSRVLLEKVGENMQVDWLEICRFEKRVTDALEMQQAAEKENWNEDEHKENRRKLALKKRYIMMGLATVGGGLVIGLSAGLLAPVIGAGLAAGFTTIGVAGTSGFLAGAGGAAIITSSAAASGGIIAVRAANRRTGAVKTFEYRPLHNNKRVNLIVTVSGWMTGKIDDVRLPYSTVDPIMGDIYSVLWEPEMLTSMGDTINILATEALTQGLQQVLGSTLLIGLMAALQLPVVLTKLAYLIDNPWTVSLDRANSAGLILADSLIDRNLGTRPVTFVGYSLGSRVIFSCLRELARKGAHGLVQNVYLFGSPIVAKKDEYLRARSVVAGRFVNGYATNDWILGYLFRLTSGGISRIAGLAPIEGIPGLENVNVTDLVPGHMAYRTAMPKLLREVGWIVESDEFTEIEDPDPENHAARQRELINEIEEARKDFEKKEKEGKGKFGWLSRKKKTVVEKKEWETYEESKGDPDSTRGMEDQFGNNHGVLFDVDAIRAELASEHMEVKELKSTLPPMKLDLSSPSSVVTNPRASLRETKSYEPHTQASLRTPEYRLSPTPSPRASTTMPPTISRQPSPHYYDEEEDGDEIQMTFDTSYHSPSVSNAHLPLSSTNSPKFPPQADPVDRAATLQRPELKSSNTLPISGLSVGGGMGMGSMTMEHNAWADEDEDFEHEKEIEMTFA